MTRNAAAAPDAVWRNHGGSSPCFLASSPATSSMRASSRRRTPDRTRAGGSCWPGPGPSAPDGARHPRVTRRSLRNRDQRHGIDQAMASTKLPSRVTEVFLTIFPPPGSPSSGIFRFRIETYDGVRSRSGLAVPDDIADRRNAVGLGFRSARRRPLGHLAVAGSRRPRYPREKSLYQTRSSPVIATRRGRDAGSGNTYSRISRSWDRRSRLGSYRTRRRTRSPSN